MGAGEEVEMSKGEVVGEGVGDRGGEKWGGGGGGVRVYNINLICQSKKKLWYFFPICQLPQDTKSITSIYRSFFSSWTV